MNSKIVKRSPKSPSASLEDAIEKAKVLYEIEGLHPIANDVAAQDLNYTNYANGAAGSVFSTLKLFGLIIVPERGKVAVSSDVQEFILNPDANAKKQLLQKWLQTPQVYSTIFEKYPSSLPSHANLRHYLVSELGFKDVKAAEQCITKLQDSIDYVTQETGSDESFSIDTHDAQVDTESVLVQPVQPVQPQNSSAQMTPEGFDRIPVRLSKGRKAWIEIPDSFLESDKKIMKDQIDLIYTEDV